MLQFSNPNSIISRLRLRIFTLADSISVQTSSGAAEFPPRVKAKTVVIPGCRPRIKGVSSTKPTGIARFVYVGGLIAPKGLYVLADAFAALPTDLAELHIYGSGDAEIVRRLREIPGVHVHGKTLNTELRRQLTAYDVFVFPTMYDNEGHPGVLIEAFMAGLPVIATDLPGINELIADGENGLIVPPDASESLATAMLRMAEDTVLREKLAAGAVQSADLYDTENVLPRLMQVMGWP